MADGLSKTLFDENCTEPVTVTDMYETMRNKIPQWVWKNGKGGYEEMLSRFHPVFRSEMMNCGTMESVFRHTLNIMITNIDVDVNDSWVFVYKTSEWFGDIYRCFIENNAPTATILRKTLSYQLINNILWKYYIKIYLPCVPENKVLDTFIEIHDDNGHWAKTNIFVRFKGLCYWPGQFQNVDNYIAGCFECARHGPAIKFQPLHFIRVTYPFQFLGINFVGPLPATAAGNKFILILVCYLNRFVVLFATKTVNVENVIWCLKILFAMYKKLYVFYFDSGQHFDNNDLKKIHREGISYDYNFSGSSKSTSMVKISNKFLEDVFRKDSNNKDWDIKLPVSVINVNGRIINHLGFSSKRILFGFLPETSAITFTLRTFPGKNISFWATELLNFIAHVSHFRIYFQHRTKMHDFVLEVVNKQKNELVNRYDRGIRIAIHYLNDLIMFYQKGQVGNFVGEIHLEW